ncbi:hypothetical protein N9L68_02315 [bacterium]|nr:hypothetical protein [bacterium]
MLVSRLRIGARVSKLPRVTDAEPPSCELFAAATPDADATNQDDAEASAGNYVCSQLGPSNT